MFGNQLAEAGISAKRYLAEGLGYGSGDEGLMKMSKDLEKGKIGSEKAIKAITEGMKEYKGMMDKTAKETVTGLWSTIEDTFEINIFRRWGQGLQDGAKKGLGSVVNLLDIADDSLAKFGDTLYEVGKTVSNWAADKLKDAVETIAIVTESDAFKNASLGGKIKILWDEVIGKPLSQWWESTGKAKFEDVAKSMGKALGEGITTALSSAWDAMPWWGKLVALLYGGSKVGGIISGVGTLLSAGAGVIGGTGTAMVGGTGIAGTLASLGYATAGGAATSTMAGGTAALLGLGTAAGIGTGLVTGFSGAMDLREGYEKNDKATQKAGWWKLGGAAGGAAAGAAIGTAFGGPVIGTAIGAAIGSGIGWWQSRKIKAEAEQATIAMQKQKEEAGRLKLKMKELAKEDMAAHFGKIALSAEEVKSVVSSMFSDELIKKANGATKAITDMENSWTSFSNADESLKKAIWLTSVRRNVKLSKEEMDGLKKSTKSYADSAKTFLKDAQYASEQSITVLMGNSKETEKVISASTAYYDKQQNELKRLTGELDDELDKALSDGVISLNEEKSLQKIRTQIQNILAQIRKDEFQAEINIVKAKYSDSDIDSESFGNMMGELENTSKTMEQSLWKEFGQGSVGLKEGSKEWKALMQSTLKGIGDTWLTSGNFGMGKLRTKWKDELGILGQDFSSMLKNNTLTEIQAAAGEVGEKTRASITEMLEHMKPTTEQIQSVVKRYEELGMKPPKALTDYLNSVEFYEALAKGPEAVEKYFSEIDIDPKIKISSPEISNTGELDKIFKVEANVKTDWHYDKFDKEWISPDGNYSFTTQALVDAGWTYDSFESKWISPDGKYWFTTDADVTTNYTTDKFDSKWIAPEPSYDFDTTANIRVNYKISGTMTKTGIKGSMNKMAATLAQDGIINNARGGIHYPTGHNVKGYADGGMVRGGARLVKVAEEGSPEMIIPLSSQRRERGLKLWEKAGEMLGVDGFFRGGRTDNGDEGIRFRQYDTTAAPAGERTIKIDLGGVNITVQVDGAVNADSIIKAVKAQGHEIAEAVAGMIADALSGQFENTPARGGA